MISEWKYSKLTLNFKNTGVQRQFLEDIRKMAIIKKKRINLIAFFQNMILSILLIIFVINNDDKYEHLSISYIIQSQTMILILNLILLLLNLDFTLLRVFYPLSSFFIISLIFAESVYANDYFCVFISILEILHVFSILSEYFESFLLFLVYALTFFAFTVIK